MPQLTLKLGALNPKHLGRSRQVMALRMLPGINPWLTALTALGVLVGATLPVISTLAIGQVIGRVPGAISGGTGSAGADRLWSAFGLVALLYVLQQTVVPLLDLAAAQLSRRFGQRLALRAMACVSDSPGVAHLDDPELLDDIERASGRAGAWSAGPAITVMSSLWTTRLSALGSCAVIVHYRWWVALPLLVLPLAMMRFWQAHYARTTETLFGSNHELRRANYYGNLLLNQRSAAEVRVFGLQDFLLGRAHTTWRAAMDTVFSSWREDRKPIAIALVAQAVLTTGALVLIARDGVTGQIGLGQVSVLVTCVFAVIGLASVDDSAHQVSMSLASLPALIKLEQKLQGLGPPGDQPVPPAAPAQRITFEGVCFGYPGRETPVFDGLDLVLEAGRSTAIVGVNGAGKTTLVKLLARMREPDSGRITVDGIDLAALDPVAWQRRVAAIFQSFVRYELSAYDNIALGAPERQHDREAVLAAAERAGIAETMAALPGGWDTPLNRQFEGGAELSGGQWQRLALARALFATSAGGATVLVLDEPTASLDVRTEADLYDRFLDLTAGLTTLVISHRFSTVRRADHIVVLDGGRVIEEGSHAELMGSGGSYAGLFALQAARYVDLPVSHA